jgi:hypothetical protein
MNETCSFPIDFLTGAGGTLIREINDLCEIVGSYGEAT